jgi:hypothetical protein
MSIFLGNKVMAELSIPNEEFPVLAKIVDMADGQFADFANALKETVPPYGRSNYVSKLSLKLPQFKQEEISRLINTIVALYRVREKMGFTHSKIADLIKEAAIESECGSMFEKNRGDILKDRLGILLAFDNTLGLGTKCVLAMENNERVCLETEISSDLRPLFSDDKDSMVAAAINHTLQITFKHEMGPSSFHITLDDNDLKLLKEEIERAQKKSSQLKSFLKKDNIFYLEG